MSDLLEILLAPSNETRLLLLLGITLCVALGMIGTAMYQLHKMGALFPRAKSRRISASEARNEASLAFDRSPAA
ncbi:MAG: hypothetical protein HY962_14055 [Ignavibacteriae bacterium]|nr:hypothetical protein [Ignavibacteriota bacterium]